MCSSTSRRGYFPEPWALGTLRKSFACTRGVLVVSVHPTATGNLPPRHRLARGVSGGFWCPAVCYDQELGRAARGLASG